MNCSSRMRAPYELKMQCHPSGSEDKGGRHLTAQSDLARDLYTLTSNAGCPTACSSTALRATVRIVLHGAVAFVPLSEYPYSNVIACATLVIAGSIDESISQVMAARLRPCPLVGRTLLVLLLPVLLLRARSSALCGHVHDRVCLQCAHQACTISSTLMVST
mmetsp:Transcript_51777/g.116247  ORF Transcript_51777/g.116247 Transcript_51777/m.116247 type:complete len:162 (-) Transcript_51777:472-957(-)